MTKPIVVTMTRAELPGDPLKWVTDRSKCDFIGLFVRGQLDGQMHGDKTFRQRAANFRLGEARIRKAPIGDVGTQQLLLEYVRGVIPGHLPEPTGILMFKKEPCKVIHPGKKDEGVTFIIRLADRPEDDASAELFRLEVDLTPVTAAAA